MAIVVYRCGVCKREVELLRNVEGLERISRCTITQGCRGKLYQTAVFDDYIRGSIPDDVQGLDNWVQRKVLYDHSQRIANNEWTITHNMGVAPAVSVFVDRPIEGNEDNREEITPTDIVYVNRNVITLRFEREYTGIAQLIGRQSDPDLFNVPERTVEDASIDITQISNNSVITIATRATAVEIDVSVQYVTTTGTNPVITYTVDDQPSINSPWVDFDRVVVNGQLYTIRSFNALVPQMTSGVINNGANFRFINTTEGSPDAVNAGDILILFATEPFAAVDKQRDIFVDVANITTANNPFALFYDSGQFFVDDTVIESVYPPIRSA